jgi:hypothetical protein
MNTTELAFQLLLLSIERKHLDWIRWFVIWKQFVWFHQSNHQKHAAVGAILSQHADIL